MSLTLHMIGFLLTVEPWPSDLSHRNPTCETGLMIPSLYMSQGLKSTPVPRLQVPYKSLPVSILTVQA